MHFSALVAAVLGASIASAHPGHDATKEQAVRRAFLEHSKKDLSHCAASIKARGLEARNIQRRSERAAALIEKKGLLKNVRDLTALNTSHLSTEDYTLETDEATIFATNNSCVLSPEVTEGPYYVAGEYVRTDVTDGQAGVDLHLEVQILDIETCEPVANAYAEIWSCNSTGVYGGVSASGNGNSATDLSNLNATYLRGVQESDDEGVVVFDTLVPGHYTGRTNHIHIMVHLNATPAANGTLTDIQASHVGQIFFDQDLITEVEATEVYATNTQQLTTNAEDGILLQEAATSDPFIEYVVLGDSVEDGLLGWLAFGIDTTQSNTVSAAAYLTESGGVSSGNAGGGGPGGAPGGGSGGFPGGLERE